MAEYVYGPIQLVQSNTPVLLNTAIPCNKGYLYHREGSGIVTLRGIVNNPSACFARYVVEFNGNIAVPTGGTAEAVAVAITLDGEPIVTSKAIVTPAAVEEYNNVTSVATITVPRGCCFNVSVDNVLPGIVATETGQAINVSNANLNITRVA